MQIGIDGGMPAPQFAVENHPHARAGPPGPGFRP